MPLIGVVDPSHEEYEAEIYGRAPAWWSIQDTLNHAKLQGPKWSLWSYETLAAIFEDHYTQKSISITTLVGPCPRSKVLDRKEDYIATTDDFYAMLRGSQVHALLEKKGRPGAIVEQKFRTKVEGQWVVAVADLVTPDGDLYDYKVSDNPPAFAYPYRSTTLQLQYNAYVLRHAMEWYNPETEEYQDHWPFVIPEIKTATAYYLGPKAPKPITFERKQPVVVTKGRHMGETRDLKRPYIFTDEEVLEGDPSHKGEPGLAARTRAFALALESYPDLPQEVIDVWDWEIPEENRTDDYHCPGRPFCKIDCLAKRYPNGLTWRSPKR